ncbi:hypothetical protein NQ318_020776 [Aromia moschata]|uniref:Uncharacterized protein n=1 Tax=Aromia moschata TaxID=1265417 RepID=A0AAV8YCN8_9CUCU|nr:hypothetical protein NQ318_020776 [Aromia moschata]
MSAVTNVTFTNVTLLPSSKLFVPNNTAFSPRRWIFDDKPIGWIMSCVLCKPFQMDHLRLASWRQLDAVDQVVDFLYYGVRAFPVALKLLAGKSMDPVQSLSQVFHKFGQISFLIFF